MAKTKNSNINAQKTRTLEVGVANHRRCYLAMLFLLLLLLYQMRAENKLKCAKSTLLFWLAHILLPLPPPLLFDAFELFCFGFSFFFLLSIFIFFCYLFSSVSFGIPSFRMLLLGVVGLVRARRVYICAATVCAIIGINAKHPNAFHRSLSFDASVVVAFIVVDVVVSRVVGDGTDV